MRKQNFFIFSLSILILAGFFILQLPGQPGANEKKPSTGERRHSYHHLTFLTESGLYDARLLLKYKDKVALTAGQEEKIQDLMLEHEAFSIRNGAEIKVQELRFTSYLKTGKMEPAEVENYIREISEIKADLMVNYINHLLDVRKILTPQQRLTIDNYRAKTIQKRKTSKSQKQQPANR